MKKNLISNSLTSLLLVGFVSLFAQRGYYDAPYLRYEANDAALTNASVTSQSYKQADLQSEASDQVCVNMSNSGASVEWTVSKMGDGLVVRYNVPNNQSGELEVFANNVSMGTLTLTSYYSWESLYNNGNPNNSAVVNENPKMRFDEVRMKLNTKIPAGGKLKLVRKSGNIHLDFAELELVPAAVPFANGDVYYNGNGSDLQDVITNNGGKTIYLPEGVYNVGSGLHFEKNNTVLKGAGMWYTQIHFTSGRGNNGGLWGNASNVSYSGLYLTTVRNSRSSSYKGLNGVHTGTSTITNVWAEHFECGAWFGQYGNGPSITDGLTVAHCRFRNNYADGINFCKGTSNSVAEHCSFRNNGDDDMAMWSANGQECRNNIFRYNTSENCWRASGCAIYGGYNNKAHHLVIKDNLEVGLRVNNNFPGAGFNTNGMHEFSEITIIRAGTFNDLFNQPVGAIDIECNDRAGTQVRNVKFLNIDIIDSKNDAIYMNRNKGDGFYNFVFENIKIDGTGKEFPNNNDDGINKGRGYGLLFGGKPTGSGTYCNMTYSNRGGNATVDVNITDKGAFSWSPASGCSFTSVTLTAPTNGLVIAECASTLTLTANASTTSGSVAAVEFYVDGQKIGTDNTSPYSYNWTKITGGSHKIFAKAIATNGTASTQEIIVSKEIGILETSIPPVIDGIVESTWSNYSKQSLDIVSQGSRISLNDLSASFQVVRSTTHLYILVDVTDDKLRNDGVYNYQKDAIEVFIDLGNNKSTTYGTSEFRYTFVYNDIKVYEDENDAIDGVVFKQGAKQGGYIMEISIPWITLGGTLNDGQAIGFDVHVNDNDIDAKREAKIAWFDATDNVWQNPSLMGTLKAIDVLFENKNVCAGNSYTFQDGTTQTNITNNTNHFSKLANCGGYVETKLKAITVDTRVVASGQNITALNENASYKWLNCNNNKAVIAGETGQIFTAKTNGSYAVEVTEEGCSKVSSCTDIVITGVFGVEDDNLTVVPNLVEGYCRIINSKEEIMNIRILSVDGTAVKALNNYDTSRVLDLSDLPSAVYIVEVSSKSYTSAKIKIQKI